MCEPNQPDDVDRLFAHLETPPVPVDLIERAAARATVVQIHQQQRQLALAAASYIVLLTVIATVAFAFGRELVADGAESVFNLAILDPAAVGSAPRDFLWALLESLPWAWLAAFVAACGALVWCVRYVAALLTPPRANSQPIGGWRG